MYVLGNHEISSSYNAAVSIRLKASDGSYEDAYGYVVDNSGLTYYTKNATYYSDGTDKFMLYIIEEANNDSYEGIGLVLTKLDNQYSITN